MTYRRRAVRSCVEDDIQRGAPPPRRSKNLANRSIGSQLANDKPGTSGVPQSSRACTETKNFVCKQEVQSSSNPGTKDFVCKQEPQSSPTYPETKDFICKQEVTDDSYNEGESTADICAICLLPYNDPTLLDSCDHSFCYVCTSQWLKYGGKCPLCMTEVTSFWHNLSYPPNERPRISVAELRAAVEAARLVERGRSLPPHHEQECVRLHIRRLKRRLHTVQEQMSNTSRVRRSSALANSNVRLVNEITRLDMLKRDASTRSELVGNIAFRSLIYIDNLDWNSIDRNANRVRFSPEVFNENVHASTERIRRFVDREMEVVWRKRKPNESREDYQRKRDSVVSSVISWCSESHINSPQFSRNLRLAGFIPPYVERFQTELFDFASSMLSLEDFDSMSAYSSKELRQLLRRRNRRTENAHEEVIRISESDTDSAVIPLDTVRRRSRHSRNSDDVIVLSDENHSGEESAANRGESNYVRDEPVSSNSDTSNFGDFYTRPACRLSQPVQPNSIRVVDSFGYSREVFPRSHSLASQDDPSNIAMSSVPNLSNNEQLHTTSPLFENGNTTIVLSSDDEDITERDFTRGNSVDVGLSQSMRDNTSLLSRETHPPYVVNWLNPSNAEENVDVEQHRHCSMSCTNATYRADVSYPQLSPGNSSLSSQNQIVSLDNCQSADEMFGEAVPSEHEANLSESAEILIVQPNASHESDRNLYGLHPPEEGSSRERSANVAHGKNHATSQCGITADSSLPEVTLCESVVDPKSLFKPAIKTTPCVSSQPIGEKELLASLWKERQNRLATSQQFSIASSSASMTVEQEVELNKEAELLEKEKTACDYCGQQFLKTSASNPSLSEARIASVADLSSYQLSLSSPNLVDVPSTSQCLERQLVSRWCSGLK
ncbi:hypothetical protein KIN20_018953 [Parelaphostrongylus tenuis]|uniref:RING-type domain-containing protein n=1 Tax=Parelaphostrongylus tenuis TaxID=148309 RepID=A0AAD5QSJ6_PARTN|nr:hypothetical protein KIN20_018953 [Parelaphostrongylus tenuis]